MTNEEKALKEIQKQQDEAEIAFFGVIRLEVPEFNAVKNALEKQIPKKIKVRTNFEGLAELYCPICDKRLISRIDGKWLGVRVENYCADCGQKIDWSDDE